MTPRPTTHAIDRYAERVRPDLEGNRPAALARLYDLIAASSPRGPLEGGGIQWRPPASVCPGRTARERNGNRVRLVEDDGAFVTVIPAHGGVCARGGRMEDR